MAKKITKVVDVVKVPKVIEVEQVNEPVVLMDSVPKKQLAALNAGLEAPVLKTMFVSAISTEVKVAKIEDVVLNGKNYIQVTTPEGVTYLV